MRVHVAAFALSALSLIAERPLQVEDLFKAKRVASPQLSARGDLAYQVGSADPVTDKIVNRIWYRPAGRDARELDLGSGSQKHPRFSPDGNQLSYLHGSQVWIVDLVSGGRRQLTHLSGGADRQIWSPDGKWIAFTSVTVPSGNEAENAAYLKTKSENKVTGLHYSTLMYRHWMEWRDPNQVSHLFVVKADGSETPRDLTPGWKHDIPNFADVSTGEDYAWSPDSGCLAFGSHPEAEKAVSTNGEIYEVSLEDGPVRKLSTNPAMDATPRYSPDGKYLAWRAQRRPGYEADRWELQVYDREKGRIVSNTGSADLSFLYFAWNGLEIIASAHDQGRDSLFRWTMGSKPQRLNSDFHVEGLCLASGRMAIQSSNMAYPSDIFEVDLSTGQVQRASFHNEAFAKELGLNRAEARWYPGGTGKDGKPAKIHAWIVKPVGFDPSKKYPVAFILHGGPQGASNDAWHPRWNAQAWAGRGFLTVLPNPRGSTGFGQQFCDEIQGDWSGLPMKDLLGVLNGVLKEYPCADRNRVVAAGGSYGGYAVNWLAGHHGDRFAAFVSHAGIFNTQSMQLATEELWFPKWDFKGFPWDGPEALKTWERNSPHKAYGQFKKPMLVVHGMKDFRVMYSEALQIYNVHQLRGIPSELLIFPDEGHFVAKPANSKYWYETVLGWCERWTK